MIGLIALGFVGLAAWIAKLGWESFRSRAPERGRGIVKIIGFFTLSAALAAAVFVASAAVFAGQRIYVFSFAVGMTILNIGVLSLLALPLRAVPSYGVFVSDALRIGTIFFIFYWFTLGRVVMKLFGIRGYF